MSTGNILAIDIGGTKLAVGIAEGGRLARTGELEQIVKEPIPGDGTPDAVIARIGEIARRMVADRGAIERIGISIGGPLDHEAGVVINFPHLPGWKDLPLCAMIEGLLGAPSRMDNDANLGGLAEHRWGAGRGYADMVYLTISTGIGGGIIIGGELLHGVGSAAAEVGHITVERNGPLCPCGNPGCLERMASGTNIARRAREAIERAPDRGRMLLELAGGDPVAITAEMVYHAAQRGERLSMEIWEETAEYLAIGLGSIIHVLAPPLIVLGGGVAQAGEGLLAPVREGLRRHVFYVPLDRIRVVAAALGHDSALLGAASLTLELPR